jgi:RNA polymerase sigma-70 factor (ECF subfamily)
MSRGASDRGEKTVPAEKLSRRLSRIKTRWTMVFQAHQGQGDETASFQRRRLLLLYYRPVYNYLRAMVRDPDVAEELTHEFAVRFLRGDFKRADPACGRFRDLLKAAVRHLAIDYWRWQRVEKEKAPVHLPHDQYGTPVAGNWRLEPRVRKPPSDPELDTSEADRAFLRAWRGQVLAQAWRALARFQEQTGCGYYTVLNVRTEHPEEHSAELARLVGDRLRKPLSEPAFRQLLRRSREKFADLVVAAVARSLGTRNRDAVEAELIEVGLHSYCRHSVARMRPSSSRGGDAPPAAGRGCR